MRFLILLFFLLPLTSHAYQYVAHVVIADTAYRMLDEENQEKLKNYANLLRDEGNLASTYDRMRSVSDFARSAYIPAAMRQETLAAIYAEFGATLPAGLKRQAGQDTTTWHYIDYPYMAEACGSTFIGKTNVETAIASMQAAYRDADDDQSRALALVYVAHLIGDAHLPVNAMSRNIAGEPGQCQADRGGEQFCIVRHDKDTACPEGKNLNRFWQNTAYRMEDLKRLRQYVRKVEKAASKLDADSLSMSVSDWTSESSSLAGFVYSTPEGEWPSRGYEAEAERISIERMAKAAIRLKRLIETL